LLTHPTLDLLHQLGLAGMAKAFGEIEASDEATTLSHPEWLALLLDREASYRSDRRLHARLRYAKLRHQAAVEDVDYRVARGLDRALFQKLAEGGWIDAHESLILCGPTGVGKSWLASALGHKACRDNRSVLYQRIPKLFADLALARGDGRYARIQRALGGVQLLILDDWGLEPLDAAARHDLLEILEERYGRRSTIITSQIPIDKWHELIGDPTYADAILDRRNASPPDEQFCSDSAVSMRAWSLYLQTGGSLTGINWDNAANDGPAGPVLERADDESAG
jgi:DNA replication protein DnaC